MSPERHDDLHQDEDALPSGLLVRTLALTLVVGAALVGVAYLLLRLREAQLGGVPRGGRQMEVPHEVANVRQELFHLARPRESLQEGQERSLAGYRWVDRQRRIVSIPVERAMELVTRGKAAR